MDKKKAIITIDTESHIGVDPVRHLIWGETAAGDKCGIPLIMDICDEYNARALFFVDIAEAWHYGERKIADVLTYIKSRGHDVGVHIHPDHMADPKRLFLYEYSKEEQYEIISKCTQFFASVLGETPIAFRAGKYGANIDTLDILSELNYQADFSEFYGQKWCGIEPPITINETVKMNNGLIEIPTMSYRNYFPGLFDRYDKLDINMPTSEHRFVLDKLIQQPEINPVVLFLHSFSLLNWRRTPDAPMQLKSEVKKLRKVLSGVSNNQSLEFSTINDILKSLHTLKVESQSGQISFSGIPATYFYFMRALRVLKMRRDTAAQTFLKDKNDC